MHGHNWNVSCFLPCKSYIWYFMVGEPPTSSIQWIRTWKWRIHTSPSWWWSEQIFFLLCLFCIVFPCNEKKQGLFLATSTNTNSFTRFVPFFFFSVPVTAAEKRTRERGWVNQIQRRESKEMGGQLYTTWPDTGDKQAPWGGRRDDGGCNSLVLPRYCNNVCWFFYFITC